MGDGPKGAIKVFHDEECGRWQCEMEGRRCFVEYTKKGEGIFDIHHTFIDQELRGRGIAEKLMDAIYDFALQNRIKVIPSCTYAEGYFRRRPERQGVLAAETAVLTDTPTKKGN